ncbi:MAG: CubicO group peptidase (beta-lactamase class C family) [Ascidiaceihabitans sp.]|jgi:CubicO group peptidase (beta-lactamase class C family)
MNRRTFNAISVAAIFAPMPRLSFAEPFTQNSAGYQIAEINDGRLTTGHGGMATQQMAVDDATLFQVASCSKTVTALAILTLVRDGRVNLDQPANRYLRRFPLTGPRGTTTTIEELMSHTAGATVHGFSGYGPNDKIPSLLEVLGGRDPANSDAVRTRHQLFGKFKYSGGGIMVLQSLIEDVTGTDFATYVALEVLTPIGAPRATFAISPVAAFAHGFFEDGKPLPGGYRRHPESAAAGLWATASDLAKILQAILHSLAGATGAILPVPLAQRMVTPVNWRSGLGVFISPDGTISHEGRNYGFDSVMAADLKTGRIRTAVTNKNGAIDSFARKLVPD